MQQPQLQFIVLTGGPGAGKTAVLEVMRHHFCKHVVILPEAASIIFSGGFPRRDRQSARCAIQRAVFRVQVELERLARDEDDVGVVLCDRGTLDGLGYWPGSGESFFSDNETSLERELSRYSAVIHMRTPPKNGGYNHHNPMRTESADEAATLDARIAEAWSQHQNRTFVENEPLFIAKLHHVVDALHAAMPNCCTTSLQWRALGRLSRAS